MAGGWCMAGQDSRQVAARSPLGSGGAGIPSDDTSARDYSRRVRLTILAVALCLALAAPAAAAPVTGSSDDPADGKGSAARDIEQVRAAFDGDVGRWVLTLRMRAPVSAAEDVRIHGILYREDPAGPGVSPSDDVTGEL